jgi:hypothetical protein
MLVIVYKIIHLQANDIKSDNSPIFVNQNK